MFTLLAQVDLAHQVSSTAQDFDINQIASLSQGNPLMVVALGAVAVLGGKKLWDFLKERQEQKHEQKLEEIKAQKEIASTGHEQCVAKQQALESQVSGLQNKLSDLEEKASAAEKKASDSMSLVEGVGELEGELKKLKKKVKKLEESAPAPKGK